ncbi:MAG: MBL fold metallo-hydrolase, partial [Gammaproteobacteria bacterium]|nr:MBL fold metallo-hydrolase [Gammaproteobacteria bacterium]
TALTLLLLAGLCQAEEHDTESRKFEVTELVAGIHLLQGQGGNIVVSVGGDGMLVVDDDYAVMSEALETALRELGGDQLRFLLNTHWHGDHTGGNAALGRSAHIIAHENVRTRLASHQEIKAFNMVQESQPAHALPVITYQSGLLIHFNGEEIRLSHLAAGHTDSDSIVYFSGSNVLHLGDHYFAGMFPFVDLENGGNVLNLEENVAAVLAWLPADAMVVPGHGPLSNVAELKAWHGMLVGTIAEVRAGLERGQSLDELQAAGLTDQWSPWTKGFVDSSSWISMIYHSLETGRVNQE